MAAQVESNSASVCAFVDIRWENIAQHLEEVFVRRLSNDTFFKCDQSHNHHSYLQMIVFELYVYNSVILHFQAVLTHDVKHF